MAPYNLPRDDDWISQATINPGPVPTFPPSSPAPQGTVTLQVDNLAPMTAALDSTGAHTFNVASLGLSPGPHTLKATYSGLGVFAPATAVTGTLQVSGTGTVTIRSRRSFLGPGHRAGSRHIANEGEV